MYTQPPADTSSVTVLGREFPEPWCKYDDLIDRTITDAPLQFIFVLYALIPLVGLGSIFGNLIGSFIVSNKYGIAQVAWQVAVYGTVGQLCSTLIVLVVIA